MSAITTTNTFDCFADMALQDRIDNARKRLENRPIALLIGAGLSTEVNLPQWKELLEYLLFSLRVEGYQVSPSNYAEIAGLIQEQIEQDQKRQIDYEYRKMGLTLSPETQEVLAKLISPKKLAGLVRAILKQRLVSSKKLNPDLTRSSLTRRIAMQCAKRASKHHIVVVTYNYDNLFERSLLHDCNYSGKLRIYQYRSDGGKAEVTNTNEDFLLPMKNGIDLMYVHGRIPLFESGIKGQPESGIVLSEKSYDNLAEHHRVGFTNLTQLAIFSSRPSLIIGFSGDDSNFVLQRKRLLDSNLTTNDAFVLNYCSLKDCALCTKDVQDRLICKNQSFLYRKMTPIIANSRNSCAIVDAILKP